MIAYLPMAPNPEATKQRLVRAAEELFAERGIDVVSLREINAAAGQRNATALQYHFHDRHGLLLAVLAKHHPDVEAERHGLLDAYEAAGLADLRELAKALVLPYAAKLADADGGRFYLRVYAQVLNMPDPRFDRSLPPDSADSSDSITRWRALVGPLLPELGVRRFHHRFTAMRVTAVELARRAAGAPRDDQLFTSHLVDLVAAVLATPISEETAMLLAERDTQDRAAHPSAGRSRHEIAAVVR